MKQRLTTATIAAISMFYAVCLFSCSTKPKVTDAELYKLSFSKGYIDGANAAIKMIDENTYSHEALKNKFLVDSAAFAKLVDDVYDK